MRNGDQSLPICRSKLLAYLYVPCQASLASLWHIALSHCSPLPPLTPIAPKGGRVMCVIDAPRQRKKSKKPRKSNPSPRAEQLTGPPPRLHISVARGERSASSKKSCSRKHLTPQDLGDRWRGGIGGGGGFQRHHLWAAHQQVGPKPRPDIGPRPRGCLPTLFASDPGVVQ